MFLYLVINIGVRFLVEKEGFEKYIIYMKKLYIYENQKILSKEYRRENRFVMVIWVRFKQGWGESVKGKKIVFIVMKDRC